jgi:hypothetical protein
MKFTLVKIGENNKPVMGSEGHTFFEKKTRDGAVGYALSLSFFRNCEWALYISQDQSLYSILIGNNTEEYSGKDPNPSFRLRIYYRPSPKFKRYFEELM